MRELGTLSEAANAVDGQYLALLQDILTKGTLSQDRTGTGTKKVFGRMLKFDLAEGYPLLTTKKVSFHSVKEELLWFIRGERNIRPLVLKGVSIWNEWPFQRFLEAQGEDQKYPKYSPGWQEQKDLFVERIRNDEEFAKKWGDLGPIYGFQWRHWQRREGGEIDQLADKIKIVRTNASSRRILITAWNPEDADSSALPPCHFSFQFQVEEDKLNCAMTMRSVDVFLGLPFNIASYALLTEIVAKITGLKPGELTLFLSDAHLYLNHFEQAKAQLLRGPRPLPKLTLGDDIQEIDSINPESIKLEGYNPHPPIKAPISV